MARDLVEIISLEIKNSTRKDGMECNLNVVSGLDVELRQLDDLLLKRQDAREALVGQVKFMATLLENVQHTLIVSDANITYSDRSERGRKEGGGRGLKPFLMVTIFLGPRSTLSRSIETDLTKLMGKKFRNRYYFSYLHREKSREKDKENDRAKETVGDSAKQVRVGRVEQVSAREEHDEFTILVALTTET